MARNRASLAVVLAAAGVLVVIAVLVALWFVVTQPLLPARADAWSSPPVDPVRLQTHVGVLTTDFLPRDWEHPENLDRAAAYIHDEFVEAGAVVTYQPIEMDGASYRNVIARFGPDGHDLIVVGAHYDAFEGFPGADDNASGVAALIELARLFGASPPPVGLELVAYTLEEPKAASEPGLFRTPFGGSANHARHLLERGDTVRVALVLEMIGHFSDEPASQDMPFSVLEPFYPSQGDFIAVIGKIGQGSVVRRTKRAMRRASPLPVYSLNGPSFIAGVDWSDHLNYWNAGYPAVMITDTGFYRNKLYHTAGDTLDRLDYRRMAAVVQGVHAAVWKFAENAE